MTYYPRINVRNTDGNHERWGKLVKTWATGKNYVRHVITEDRPYPTEVELTPEFPKPTTFRIFVDQARLAGVALFFDDGVKNPDVTGDEDLLFAMYDVPPGTAYVKLPQNEKILESEDRLRSSSLPYPFLADFYERIHGTAALPSKTSSQSQKAILHAERVGEYTINTCG
ncbi:hypothetical protein [Bradyrhizobium sp. 930_D9_N1_4]|uniref:hypothetical protein n=1 Tax=Bradyrhizobium sp. 930_D9_N1_4 TaxID=3240374 RepID=UPI003F8B25B3